ncbi:MAG: TraR/DksA family transcriptional regulator [Woeseiaceae bacterium]
MSELSKNQIEAFRKSLLENRKLIMTAIEGETKSAATVELDQSTMGRLSRMDALQGQAMSKETKSRHEEGVRKISSALSRIESGDYGYCFQCDELISMARLEVDPAVSLCITCASLAEKV